MDDSKTGDLEQGKLAPETGTYKGRTLGELIDQITPENVHPELFPGSPVGREIY